MKAKNLWLRIAALCLALVCTLTVVLAAGFDLSGDGKVDVWDLQLAVNQGETATYDDALIAALGGADELHPNAQGVYEIWSPLGVYNMAKNAAKGYSFKLMANVDMGGVDWKPIDTFYGTLDGNLMTISNLNITGGGTYQGFIRTIDRKQEGDTYTQAEVKNLNLKDVNITASTGARFIGLLVGNNRGIITNCTTEGTVTDKRTKLENHLYVGTIAGNNADATQPVPSGKIDSGTNLLTATVAVTHTDVDTVSGGNTVSGVTSKMATFFAEPAADCAFERHTGIAGYSKAENINTAMIWQDITNSTELESQAIQQRRATVAEEMYKIGTVEWMPSQTMTYYVYKTGSGESKKIYTEGELYRGQPYNHGSAGMDRFNAYIGSEDLPETAQYITSSTVTNALNTAKSNNQTSAQVTEGGKTFTVTVPDDWTGTEATNGTYVLGFAKYVGNDCSSAAAWAWRSVSAVSGTGYTNPQSTGTMIPTAANMKTYGIVSVNGMSFDTITDQNGDGKVNQNDYAAVVKALFAGDSTYFWDTLAKTSKGDLLMGYNSQGGHTRLAAADAMVIRNYQDKIDTKKSFVITHEQGGGGSTGVNANGSWKSSCRVNWKYTFADLTTTPSAAADECIYFPITCTALQEENTPAATPWCKMSSTGTITSNFHIVKTSVNGGTPVYTNVKTSGVRNKCVSLDVTTQHLDIEAGSTVTVLLANGQTYEFTY